MLDRNTLGVICFNIKWVAIKLEELVSEFSGKSVEISLCCDKKKYKLSVLVVVNCSENRGKSMEVHTSA